jgi:putative ABC transport system permease protein
VWRDVRLGFRTLMHNPGFSAAALLILALGIGANTAVFSIAKTVLLDPLPYPDSDRLLTVWMSNEVEGRAREAMSRDDFADYAQEAKSFENLALYRQLSMPLTGNNEPEQLTGLGVSASFFDTLRSEPAVGRIFRAEEEEPGRNQVIIITDGLWKRRFGGDRSIIGRTITLGSAAMTVIGIMPAGFSFPDPQVEFWTPIRIDASEQVDRRQRFLNTIGRLKREVTLQRAEAEAKGIAARLAAAYPQTNAGWSIRLVPAAQQIIGDARLPLLVIMAGVAFVLLIACANVANLQFARATKRRREISIRMALGAGKASLFRTVFAESLLLALGGGFLGAMVAVWLVPAMIALTPAGLPRLHDVRVDGMVFLFATVLSLLTGVAFGVVPALQASRDPGSSGSLAARTDTVRRRPGFIRWGLVSVEIGLSIVLLTGAVLMTRSFIKLSDVAPGFNTKRLLTFMVAPPATKYRGIQLQTFFTRVLAELEGVAGVQHVGAVTTLPMSRLGADYDLPFSVEGRPPFPKNAEPQSDFRIASPGYFLTMEIPILRGREFELRDTAESPPVMVINDVMAREIFPNEDPIGRRIGLNGRIWEIVGIVGNVRHRDLALEPRPEFYVPFLQSAAFNGMMVVVRSEQDPASVLGGLKTALRNIDPEQPISYVQTMDEVVSHSVVQPRFRTVLIGSFSIVALVLACIGIYGVLAYSVSQRNQEIGIRISLGASRNEILRMSLREGMLPATVGTAAGVLASLALTRYLSTLLYEIGPRDVLTFIVVPVALLLVAAVACYIPARRAASIDPIMALRDE